MDYASASRLPIFLSYLLRHAPQVAGLDMPPHVWVSVTQLIQRARGGFFSARMDSASRPTRDTRFPGCSQSWSLCRPRSSYITGPLPQWC